MKGSAWDQVRRILEAQGHRTKDGVSRAVSARVCRRCSAPVLAAIAREGFAADADPEPLSPLGEALAVLTGRPTFALRRVRGRLELDLRDSFEMRHRAAGTGTYDVVAGHACGADPLPSARSVLPAPPTRKVHATCPF